MGHEVLVQRYGSGICFDRTANRDDTEEVNVSKKSSKMKYEKTEYSQDSECDDARRKIKNNE